jgi:hypothetical protein
MKKCSLWNNKILPIARRVADAKGACPNIIRPGRARSFDLKEIKDDLGEQAFPVGRWYPVESVTIEMLFMRRDIGSCQDGPPEIHSVKIDKLT